LPSPYSALAGLTVCTNSIDIFRVLGSYEVPVKTIVVGGSRLGMTETIAGSLAEQFLSSANINFSIAIVGATNVDLKRNVCCSDTPEEQVLKQTVFQHSNLRVVLVDDSKFKTEFSRENYSFVNLTPEQVDLIITNMPLDERGEPCTDAYTVDAHNGAVDHIRNKGIPVLEGSFAGRTPAFSKEYTRGRELNLRVAHDFLEKVHEKIKYPLYQQSDAMERLLNKLLEQYAYHLPEDTARYQWMDDIISELRGYYQDRGLSERNGNGISDDSSDDLEMGI